jgi:hypothetical protein
MLSGEKPLAVFSDVYPNRIGGALYANQPFEKYVAKGLINRTLKVRKVEKPNHKKGVYSIFRDYYTHPGEEWRIVEYEKLWDGEPWAMQKERREGELLGYTDEENDEHIARLRST